MKIWLSLLLLAVLCQTCVSKGGARVGSSRGSSSRGSSSYTYSRGSYRATNIRTWSRSQKTTALTLGMVFISSRVRSRFGSSEYYSNNEVNICQNENKYSGYNGSTTEYGWFLCPLDDSKKTHCCGSVGAENCCTYWNSSDAIWVYVVIVFLSILAISLIIFCIVKMAKKTNTLHPRPPNPDDYSPRSGSISTSHTPQEFNAGFSNDVEMSPPPSYQAAMSTNTGQFVCVAPYGDGTKQSCYPPPDGAPA